PKDREVNDGKKDIEVDESRVSNNDGKDEQATRSESERLNQKEMQNEHINSTNSINTVSTPVIMLAAASCCGQAKSYYCQGKWLRLDEGHQSCNCLTKLLSLEALFEGRFLISMDERMCYIIKWNGAALLFLLRAEQRQWFEITSKQSIDPPLSRGYTLGSGEDSMKLIGINGILLKLVLPVFVSAVKHMLMLPVQVSAVEVNGVRQLQALVDKKRVIVTASSIRRDPHLDDVKEEDPSWKGGKCQDLRFEEGLGKLTGDVLNVDTGVLEDDEISVEAKVVRKGEQSTKPDDSTAGEAVTKPDDSTAGKAVTTANVESSVVPPILRNHWLRSRSYRLKQLSLKLLLLLLQQQQLQDQRLEGQIALDEQIAEIFKLITEKGIMIALKFFKEKAQNCFAEQIERYTSKLDAKLLEEQSSKETEEKNIGID
ncbi:hypothetical protein Tco_0581325, partial [Tanacetum coccineum]